MTATRPRWPAELIGRMRSRFLLKLVGTTGWIWMFFIGYFHTMRHPVHAPFTMPPTALDRWVPTEPWALPVYLSLWLYVGIAPGLQRTLAELLAYGAWSGALLATGLVLFYLWPTATLPTAFDTAGVPGFEVLQGIDAAGNACPSMHVAAAVFTALWLDHVFRATGTPTALRLANLVWCTAIAWSTLATRQHVALDVGAGALLGGGYAWASLAWQARRREPARRPDIIDRLPVDISS